MTNKEAIKVVKNMVSNLEAEHILILQDEYAAIYTLIQTAYIHEEVMDGLRKITGK